uniref:Uncharacterized protein n=1 Tax=viral metagenome TaxID=1070528 RepID=A0A6C0F6J6_9ZZZZ
MSNSSSNEKEVEKAETKAETAKETAKETKAEVAKETIAEVAKETIAEEAKETIPKEPTPPKAPKAPKAPTPTLLKAPTPTLPKAPTPTLPKETIAEVTKAEVAEVAETKATTDDLVNFFGETKESIFLKESLLDIENAEINLSSDDEEEEIVKIENNIEYNILDKYHPEIKQLNNNELNSKIIIKRNKDGFIDDVNHTTLPIMTRYERAKIIGLRATQINSGTDILIDIPDNIIDGITIAKMELVQKKIPFIIRRPLPNGKSEYWDINDLEIIE